MTTLVIALLVFVALVLVGAVLYRHGNNVVLFLLKRLYGYDDILIIGAKKKGMDLYDFDVNYNGVPLFESYIDTAFFTIRGKQYDTFDSNIRYLFCLGKDVVVRSYSKENLAELITEAQNNSYRYTKSEFSEIEDFLYDCLLEKQQLNDRQ